MAGDRNLFFQLIDLPALFADAEFLRLDLLFQRPLDAAQTLNFFLGCSDREMNIVISFPAEMGVQRLQIFEKSFVPASLPGLALQRTDLPFHLLHDIGQANQVSVRVFELSQSLFLLGFALRDSSGVLEYGPP